MGELVRSGVLGYTVAYLCIGSTYVQRHVEGCVRDCGCLLGQPTKVPPPCYPYLYWEGGFSVLTPVKRASFVSLGHSIIYTSLWSPGVGGYWCLLPPYVPYLLVNTSPLQVLVD